MNEKLATGRICTAHGTKGYVKAVTYSGEVDQLVELEEIELIKGGKKKRFRVEDVKRSGKFVLIKLAGIETPEIGKTLANWEIWIERSTAIQCEENEHYVADLVGCVIKHDGRRCGEVSGICETGAGDMLEVNLDGEKAVLIPFREEFIGTVDVEEKSIELLERWVIE